MENKRVEAGDAMAILSQGNCYSKGSDGFPQDRSKALELWQKAGELRNATGYHCIGLAYCRGDGVEVDKKKGKYYLELAAIKGDASARGKLGWMEEKEAGNVNRAMKHYLIAVAGGHYLSLKMIYNLHSAGHATEEVYTQAVRSYHEYLGEIMSVQRNEAAAYEDNYKYYCL